LRSRGTDSPRRSTSRLEVADQELAAKGDFAHLIVNDDLSQAIDELERIVREELGLAPQADHLHRGNDQTTRRQSFFSMQIPLRRGRRFGERARQINSYFHNLGEGGFGEYPPPMVETNAEGNYLTMALEELAEGKAQIRVPHLVSGRPPGRRPEELTDGTNPAWRERWDRRLQGARVGAPGDPRRARACAC